VEREDGGAGKRGVNRKGCHPEGAKRPRDPSIVAPIAEGSLTRCAGLG
jgi:hypothetical protein